MPLTVDEPKWVMRIECDGEPSPLGCRVADEVQANSRVDCNEELYRKGWRLRNNRTLCWLCVKREEAKDGRCA